MMLLPNTRSPAPSTGHPATTPTGCERLPSKTRTTKANVATALQMITWGVKSMNSATPSWTKTGNLSRSRMRAMTDEMWAEMVAYAKARI